jgi:uncharacterized protein YutD
MVIAMLAHSRVYLVRDLHLEGCYKQRKSVSKQSLHIGDLQHYDFQLCVYSVTYLSRSRS